MHTPPLLRLTVAILRIGVLGLAIGLTVPPRAVAQFAPETVFQNRLEAYVNLRDEIARLAELPLEPTDARTAAVQRRRLGSGLRVMRADVPQGNIFGGSVATLFRRIVAATVVNEEVRYWVELRAHAPGVERVRVNAPFPVNADHDVHPALLRVLPPLPPGIMYRVVHYDLLLWDARADLVIDMLPGAFAAQTT